MENINMKQNKKIVAIIMAIFVVFGSISISAYAYTDNSVNDVDFSDQPIPFDNSSNLNNGIVVYSYENKTGRIVSTSGENNYIFSVSANGYFYFYAASQESNSVVYWNNGSSITSVNLDSKHNNTNLWYKSLYFNQITGLNSSYINVPVFSSETEGFNAVLDWIENPPIISTSYKLEFTMPAGTIAFIDIENDDYNSVFMTVDSNFAHKSPFTGNQAIGYANAMPSSNFTLPYPNTTAIQWNGYGGKTLLRMYKSWSYRQSVNDSNGKYLVIVNPLVAIDSTDDVDNNNPISVSVDQVNSYKVFSLSGGWSDGSISYSSDGQSWTGSYDPNTNTWSVIDDVTGSPGTPTSGNIGVTQNNVHNWLETISKQIGSFFSGAIGAVTNLVGAGSEFIGKLGALYSWLPPAVYSVLTSALILVITIGVIKVFI